MKAYHILLFLFIFNMFFWVVTTGLGIYQYTVASDPAFDLSSAGNNTSVWTISLGLISRLTMLKGFVDVFGPTGGIIALAILFSAAAMAGYLTAGQAPQGIVYGLFGVFFWTSLGNTLTLLFNLSNQHIGALYILVIFGMIIGVIFIVGLFQMVTGGWKSYE